MKRLAYYAGIPALAAVVLLACGGEVTPPLPGDRFEPVTPEAVLKNVVRSWNRGDFELFTTCLAPDFAFYFNPDDVGVEVEGYQIPVSWNRAEMEEAVVEMLTHAYSADMSIPTSTVGTPREADKTWRADNVTVAFTLLTSPGSGFRVGAGYCDFVFKRYEEGGQHRWRLTEWRDLTRESRATAAAPGICPSSLGRMLALYN